MLSPAFSAASSALPDLVMDEPTINDFSDLFDFESAAVDESDLQSHSPTTISPNHTPSPVIAPSSRSPIARSPSPRPFGLDLGVANEYPYPDVQVKEEPMDFSYGFDLNDLGNAPPVPSPLPLPLPSASAYTMPNMPVESLPQDQQAALQQLMLNLLQYQKQYGPVDGTPAPSTQPTTIEPSLVFSSSPTNTFSSSGTNTGNASASGSGSQTRSYVSPAPLSSIYEHDEPLQAIDPNEQVALPPVAVAGPSRAARQTSIFSSADDLDSKLDRLAPRDSIFSAGKGKGGKKGGGLSSVVRGDDEDLDDDDSWRPSPEEYKKLSSKEKRQLRNKLSARAFRTRRKDYIGTLEGHIKDRDDVIDEMRSELVTSRNENQDLRRELEALKASTMKIIHPESANVNSQSPALMNALALPSMQNAGVTATTAAAATPKRAPSAAPTPTFNPHKDIASSSTQASRGFWGNDNMFGGGSTICHHTFTPPPVFPRTNLNPLLNDPAPSASPAVPNAAAAAAGQVDHKDLSQPFSDWSADTTFNFRSMDAYRMQMWSRLTREAQAERDHVPLDLRPKFYVEPKSANPVAASTTASAEATLAGAAVSHITSKLASSFWSAFSGPSSLDTDKLAAVVTGSAKLAVVPSSPTGMFNEKTPTHAHAHAHVPLGGSAGHGAEDDASLAQLMSGLKMQTGREVRAKVRENPLGVLSHFIKHASSVPARA